MSRGEGPYPKIPINEAWVNGGTPFFLEGEFALDPGAFKDVMDTLKAEPVTITIKGEWIDEKHPCRCVECWHMAESMIGHPISLEEWAHMTTPTE